MELLLLGIFAAVLLLCVFTGISIIYAMILGLVLFFTYGLIKKKTWKQMQEKCQPVYDSIRKQAGDKLVDLYMGK